MSRSNYDKPFYVDVGTSIVAIRCASNHDVIMRYAIVVPQHTLKLAEDVCDRMNKEAEIGRPRRNCDVGTADEQFERYRAFCDKYDECCTGCPCGGHSYNFTFCFAKWAQLPYVEGGAE